MRELPLPNDVHEDPNATEMIRFWLANGEPNLSLRLGVYEDIKDGEIDEIWAWSNFLSDIAQHVANGLEQQYGYEFKETMNQFATDFLECIKERSPGLEGGFPDESHPEQPG